MKLTIAVVDLLGVADENSSIENCYSDIKVKELLNILTAHVEAEKEKMWGKMCKNCSRISWDANLFTKNEFENCFINPAYATCPLLKESESK